MALDNTIISALTFNLKNSFAGCRINKINQPNKDEIALTVRNNDGNQRLLISANSSNPLIYIENDTDSTNPLTPPNFCSILRKYIGGGKIIDIIQPDHDRIIEIIIARTNELGDMHNYRLITEFMGKHSNIILVNENNRILDSIKHIDASTSSIRQIFPGSNYFRVFDDSKFYPLDLTIEECISKINSTGNFYNELLKVFKGISPKVILESCHLAKIDSSDDLSLIEKIKLVRFFESLNKILKDIEENKFVYLYYTENDEIFDYSVIDLTMYSSYNKEFKNDVFSLVYGFYSYKINKNRMNNKTSKIKQVINNNIKRLSKKLNIWDIQLDECNKKDKFKLYGELLLANTYRKDATDNIIVDNYYDGSKVKIKLDKQKDIASNSQKYYKKYNKLKRTETAILKLYPETEMELNYLLSVNSSINNIENNSDLDLITYELESNGYLKNIPNKNKSKKIPKTLPLHFIDDLGYEYYVGKNNLQNEFITFQVANQNDWWFHVKDVPGSHVILKSTNQEEIPDKVFITAAKLAAYYNKSCNGKIEVDYTQRKNIKKPKNGHTGMVIYNTNYSIVVEKVEPENIKQL